MADTETKSRPRRTPVAQGVAESMPEPGVRQGFWKSQFEDVLSKNPGVIYTYGDVSESTASNLRKDYGLTCATKGSTDKGNLVLYVQWVPENAEQIKADTIARGEKRRATIAANKANGKGASKPAASRS